MLQESREELIVGRTEELDDLVTALGRLVHEEHSNPGRAGCPGRPAIAMLAKESPDHRSHFLLEHIRNCAPCLDELRELRLALKRSQ